MREVLIPEAIVADSEISTIGPLGRNDFTSAFLDGADLSDSELNDAILNGASLKGAECSKWWHRDWGAYDLAENHRPLSDRLPACAQLSFEKVLFEWTCRFGLSPGRPLRLVFYSALCFSAFYLLMIKISRRSGFYLSKQKALSTEYARFYRIGSHNVPRGRTPASPLHLLVYNLRLLRVALFFSLMSALNLGFRELDFGRWFRMLTKHEYNLRAVGWARTLSGIQSLLSVYLVGLWVLSYFANPFGN